MAKLLKIAKTKDVPPGQAAAFTIEGQKIALFNVEGTYYAIGDTCTHRGGPPSEGDVQGTRVTCPWHVPASFFSRDRTKLPFATSSSLASRCHQSEVSDCGTAHLMTSRA